MLINLRHEDIAENGFNEPHDVALYMASSELMGELKTILKILKNNKLSTFPY